MMGRVSDMAIGLQEEARDELLCEIDHHKQRLVEARNLIECAIIQFTETVTVEASNWIGEQDVDFCTLCRCAEGEHAGDCLVEGLEAFLKDKS